MNPQNINASIEGKVPEEALETLGSMIAGNPDDPAPLIARGKLLWSLGRRGEAMTDYSAAARIDPDGPARLLLEHSSSIMDFFNPDLLNP